MTDKGPRQLELLFDHGNHSKAGNRAKRREVSTYTVGVSHEAPPPMLHVGEIARQCSVHTRTVCNWIRSGQLCASQFGRSYRVSKADFQRFIDGSAVRSN